MIQQDRRRVRAILWEWGATMSRVQRWKNEINALHLMIEDVHDPTRAQVITGMPGANTTGDPTAQMALRAADMITSFQGAADVLERRIKDALEMKAAIDNAVGECLTAIQREVIEKRYIGQHSWEYVALKMSYAESKCRDREREAVDTLSLRIF